MTEYYPIDVSGIKKGDYISPERISEIYGIQEGETNFWTKILQLRGFIERRSFEDGNPLLTKGEGKGIRILSDEEAASYENKCAIDAKRAFGRRIVRMAQIDSSQLSAERARRLEHDLFCRTTEYQAIKGAEKKLSAGVTERQTPGLVEHKKS